MKKNSLLIEILTEELPPTTQKNLGDHFGSHIANKLKEFKLIDATEFNVFSTPRRLAVKIYNVQSQTKSELKLIKLMPKKIAFDASNKMTQPLLKKITSLGEDESCLKHLKIKVENNQEMLFLEKMFDGHKLQDVIENILIESIKTLPIAKTMNYQLKDGWTTVNFVRPAKNLLAVFGNEILHINLLGLKSNNSTFGHRFESNSKPIKIINANDYEEKMLKEGNVIVDFDIRKNKIWDDILNVVNKLNKNFKVNSDEVLLNEVTALVEMPNILIGKFDKKFLNIPPECLELTMKSNQKYFPILNEKDDITNNFVIVSNLKPKKLDFIIQGNEKVIHPRLADAEFFYKQDKKESLGELAKKLSGITYHNKLGTQHDRALRVSKIHAYIDKKLNFNNKVDFVKLALASKADLSSLMVGEFPELQGVMGSYYAKNDGENNNFSEAIEDHYKPKFSGDLLPRNTIGIGLSLADKIETLVSLYSINEIPTGDKDPFALRRTAIGIIRILIEKNLSLNIIETIKQFYPSKNNFDELITFIKDRLINFLRDQNFTAEEVDAVTCNLPNTFNTILNKLHALRSFVDLDDSAFLASSNKRVTNILKKYEFDNDFQIKELLLIEEVEKKLYKLLISLGKEIKTDTQNEKYIDALSKLIKLKTPIDNFFDNVMVNSEDKKLKKNRHNLLKLLHQTLNIVADISKLAT